MTESAVISAEARRYLKENLPVDRENFPDPGSIVSHRQQIAAECQPGIDAIIAEFEPTLHRIRLGGIDCLEVVPNSIQSENKVLLYLFGGGFITGSPEEDIPIVAVLASELQMRAVCPRYRLAPEHPYPAAIEDGMSVYAALVAQYGSGNIVVCGESTGGNLAMQLVLRGMANGRSPPAALALLSPWADLSNGGDSIRFNDGRDPSLSEPWVGVASDLYAAGLALDAPELSPLFASIPPGFPPTLITSGTRDLLLSHGICLAHKLRRAGTRVETRVWEEMWHVFEWYPALPEARESLLEIAAFLHDGK